MASGGVSVTDQAAPTSLKVIGTDTVVPFRTTLSAAANIADTQIIVADASGYITGASITIVDGANLEVVEISGAWNGTSTTVPLKTPLQFAHASGVAANLVFHEQIISIGDPNAPSLRAGIDSASGGLKVAIVAGGSGGGGQQNSNGQLSVATASATWTSGSGWNNPPPATGVLYGVTVVNAGTTGVRLNDGAGGSAIPLWIYQANELPGESDPMPGKAWQSGLNWSGVAPGLVVTIFYGTLAAATYAVAEVVVTPSNTSAVIGNYAGTGTLFGVLVSASGSSGGSIQDGNGNTLFVYPANSGEGDLPIACPKPYSNGLYAVGAASGNPTLVLTVAGD